MGVPALFRWLSRKYPKIVQPVAEELPGTAPGKDGRPEETPVDTTQANPNGEEFDNLYLDMNGIVHPCTHPEGKPAPKNEEEMMYEIFRYTDRVVNMIRPRKVLMMAIDGVAPRAKMNQQRSRRFRSSQDAKIKEEERLAAIEEWEARGRPVSEEYKHQGEKAWDSNAITPGTPFMDLLARSLRYWVAKKLNEDPMWAGLEVIISDASVPGEGEHKIMDWIRRQRSQPAHDPNTSHVIYGLDADLIMLSLATHEPHFKVLREDVFAQDNKRKRGCHRCGEPGHHSSKCTGPIKPPEQGKAPSDLKPFIFLDVEVLREYLAIELSTPQHGFAFDLERAIDDWVFMCFFVGNDFLPHLPSLDIREGAIDVLITIWKQSLARMGGYLADSGTVNLERAQLILDALAMREDEIFRKRREAEERQDRAEKRRRIGDDRNGGHVPVHVTFSAPSSTASTPVRPGTPQQAPEQELSASSKSQDPKDVTGMLGSSQSIVANRRQLRMAGMNADEIFKAEMKDKKTGPPPAIKANRSAAARLREELKSSSSNGSAAAGDSTAGDKSAAEEQEDDKVIEAVVQDSAPDLTATPVLEETAPEPPAAETVPSVVDSVMEDKETRAQAGVKRSHDEVDGRAEEDGDVEDTGDDDDDADEVDDFIKDAVTGVRRKKLAPIKMTGNVAEQEDQVRLYEPGYKERYYRQKFGVELSDTKFRRAIVKSYMEGLCWVLMYYYQGAPSWKWYYPYHFAPFASDFENLKELDITFEIGEPFRPFEQLMGVFPAASRVHLPEPFQELMTEDDSPIKDFYPEDFEIDMNGKKMIWQGVALLPFIDEARLLGAMRPRYERLSDDEHGRNERGSHFLFVAQEHGLFDYLEGLYTKRKIAEPVELDTTRSRGITGGVLPDPNCVPGSTFISPLGDSADVESDRSISCLYSFPSQLTPHQSALLPGARRRAPVLNSHEREAVRRGAPMEERHGGGGGGPSGFHGSRHAIDDPRTFGGPRRGGGRQSYPPANGYGARAPPPPPIPQQGAGGYGRQQHHYNGSGPPPPPPPRDPYSGYSAPHNGGGYGGGGYAGAYANGGPPGGYGGSRGPPPPPPPMQAYGGGGYGAYAQGASYHAPPPPSYGGIAGLSGMPPPPAPQQRAGAPQFQHQQPQYGGYVPPSARGRGGGPPHQPRRY